LRQALAQADLALQRIEIDALANAAIADGFDVFLGVFGSNGIFLIDWLFAGRLGLLEAGCDLAGSGAGGGLCANTVPPAKAAKSAKS